MSSCPCRSEKWLFCWAKMNTSAKTRGGTLSLPPCSDGGGESFLARLTINQRLFFDKNLYLYCMYKLCFLRRPAEVSNCSVLDFCSHPSFCLLTVCWLGSQSMFALFSLVHTFPLIFNLCKAGISWTSRNAVCFFYSSRKQKLFPRARTAAHGWQPKVVSFVKTRLCVWPPSTMQY